MLLENDKHRKYHSVGPKDLSFGARNEKGELRAIAQINVTRQTIDNEQMSFSVPVFAEDSREDIDTRLGFFMSLAQERIEEANAYWALAAAKADEEEKANLLKSKQEIHQLKKGK